MPSHFQTVIGTGGIGSGVIYRLQGAHDLGRNESRLAQRVDQRDFCKLHIIFHYIAVLCRDLGLKVRVYPVGAVGPDPEGQSLLAQMKQAGMHIKFVRTLADARTLFSVCYQFPDGSGGNITELNSASGKVSAAMIRAAATALCPAGPRCLALAAPEVPFESRLTLLRLAKRNHAITAASFVADEMAVVRRQKCLALVDLLSINLEEAAALAAVAARQPAPTIVAACRRSVQKVNPRIQLCITDGKNGAYGIAAGQVEYLRALRVPVVNTAGAGDAALAGLIVGVLTGQPFLSRTGNSCLALSRLVSAMSVTSPDTIHFGLNLKSLRAFAAAHGQKIAL